MRILLLSPPTNSVIKEVLGTTGPPLGLAYIASMVRDAHDVKIIDSLVEDLTYEDVKRRMKKYDPELIGITATTSMMPDAYIIAKIAKKENEDVKIVMGGPHVTFVPERTFKECPCIDFIVRGEGEITFKELVDAIDKNGDFKNIRGLSYKDDGKVINNPPRELIKDVDTIPLPSYDLLPMDKYQADGVKFGTVMTSRGCPYNCIFCSSSLQFGRRWRGHSRERVMKELKILNEEYGIREIEFLDDTFTLNRKRAVDIADEIKREKMDIRWSASSRVNTFSRKIAKAMKEGGCHTVYFGIESGTQRILNFIGKGITLEQALKSVKDANDFGLNTLGSFIIGFPDESKDEVKKTIKFSKKVGVRIAQFTIATPYPGTRLWNLGIARRIIKSFDWRKYTTLSPVMKLKCFPGDTILKYLGIAYATFYLRPKEILWDLIKNRGFIMKRIFKNMRGMMNSLRAV